MPATTTTTSQPGSAAAVLAAVKAERVAENAAAARQLDLAATWGTPVLAARDGMVGRSGWWGTYGNAVALDHGDGSETRYAHLSSVAVGAGEVVRQGDVIGYVGSTGASTGPHLHFELRFDGRAVDPLGYLVQAGVTAAR